MPNDIAVFAETNFRNQRRRFGIKRDDRRRHMYLVGKTGMGKSTMLENMVIADIRAGEGVALVDPHGDLAEKILDFIPSHRVNDVIYFNPSDTQFPIAFNILESVGPDYKHLVAYGLVGVFKKIWADSWGPRMEYIMTNTILALLDYPGSTLLGLMRMLVDKAYRKKVVAKVMDPVVKTFWADEYANYSEKFRTEAIAPIQNKVGQFLASAIIRNIVGQSKSTIEMREVMDNQKILIMNLAKGRIGEENSALLGAMMITKLQIAAMSRVDVPEEQRKDFFLYVDEFQNFATDSFAGILSEARKYRLCLIMAHQYFEQLGDVVKAAVFGNVGTMIVFRVGATDAAELELEFAPQFLPTDIVNLKKYTVCMRLMVDGVATEPFSAIGLAPATDATGNKEKVIKVSRERYARPQELVEDRIIRWSGVEINRPEQPNADNPAADGMVDSDPGDDMDWPEPSGAQPVAAPALAATDEPTPLSSYVNAAGFIPGDITPPVVPPVATAPVVRLEPAPVASPMPSSSVAVTAVGSARPRISFVNHPPKKIADNVEQNHQGNPPKETVEKPVPPPADNVSLSALKQGTAPQVQFATQSPAQSSSQPSPQPANGSDGQRRKRKRNRNRNRGVQPPAQTQQPQPRPQPSPMQPQPPKPQPVKPQPSQPQPAAKPDPNKVSWNDLLQ